jgi:hypothetical protein
MPDAYDRPISPLSPHIFVSNAVEAIDFYKKAFNPEELTRHAAPDGKRLMHAALLINGATLMLCDDFPEYCGGKSSTRKLSAARPLSCTCKLPKPTRCSSRRSTPAPLSPCRSATNSGEIATAKSRILSAIPGPSARGSAR